MELNTTVARQVDGYDNPARVKDDDDGADDIQNVGNENGKGDVENQTENDLNVSAMVS